MKEEMKEGDVCIIPSFKDINPNLFDMTPYELSKINLLAYADTAYRYNNFLFVKVGVRDTAIFSYIFIGLHCMAQDFFSTVINDTETVIKNSYPYNPIYLELKRKEAIKQLEDYKEE